MRGPDNTTRLARALAHFHAWEEKGGRGGDDDLGALWVAFLRDTSIPRRVCVGWQQAPSIARSDVIRNSWPACVGSEDCRASAPRRPEPAIDSDWTLWTGQWCPPKRGVHAEGLQHESAQRLQGVGYRHAPLVQWEWGW